MDERVVTVIRALSPSEAELKDSVHLKHDLGFDSLKIVQLMVSLEEALQIEFDESDLDPAKLLTVADLNKLVCKYV